MREGSTRSVKTDAFYSQAKDSGGDAGFGYFADFFIHQGGSDRGLQRNFAGVEVHLVGADYLEFHTGICRKISKFHLAQEAYPVFGKGIGVEHTRMFQDFLQETDAADGFRLGAPGLAVSRVIAPVALGAHLCKFFLHLWVNLVYKMIKFGCNLVVSLF